MADRELPVQVESQASGSLAQSRQRWPGGYAYPEMGGYFGEAQSGDSTIDLREIARVLLKRRRLIGGAVGVCVALGLLWSFLQKPLYTASLRLQIDKTTSSIFREGAPGELNYTDDYINTELELLKGRNIAERVASRLHLGKDGSGKGGAGAVLGGVSVKPLQGTRLVDISYTDPSPSRAQMVANAYGDAYVDANLDKRFQANQFAKSFLEDQLQQLKNRLEESEKAMIAFAEKEQIVAGTDRASIADSNLSAANAALGALVAERIRNEQLWRQAQASTGIDIPQLLSNRSIDELRARRNSLLADWQEKSQTYRPNYPDMVQLNSRIKETEHQLELEVKTVKASLKAAYEGSLNQEAQMRQNIEKLRQEVLDLQKRSIQYNILKREVDSTRSIYESLLQRYKEVDVASGVGTNNVFIVERAGLPGGPSSPNRSKAMLVALGIGLVIGVAGAFAMEHFDDVIHDPADAEEACHLTMHGVIPKPPGNAPFELAAADPRSSVSEAFRSTCTSLQFSTETGAPKTLVITSATPGEGKSSVSFGLAGKFAALGQRVLVIDADLRKPALHEKAGVDNSIGLSTYLTHNCELSEAVRQLGTSGIHIICAGPNPPNPVELLNGARFASLISSSSEVFDMVIIDGPPVMGMADALVLGNIAKATLFVVAAGQGRAGLIRNALKRLRRARIVPLGLIVTKFDARKTGFGLDDYSYGYGYGYGYGYAYGYTGDDAGGPGQIEDDSDGAARERHGEEAKNDGSAAA